MLRKQRILVQDGIEVRDPPVETFLVVDGQHVEEIVPLEVGLELDDVLHRLLIIVTEQDLGEVLVLHVQLHRRFDQAGQLHKVGSVSLAAKDVEDVAVVFAGILRSIGLPWGAADVVVVAHIIGVQGRHVLVADDRQVLVDLGLENANRGLLDSQVGHLYVEAVEVDAL